MNNKQLVLVPLITSTILIIFIQEGWSIKCWDCRSDLDEKCGDPFDNKTFAITDCKQAKELKHLPNLKATMCRKTRQKVNGKWTYFRGCAYMGEPGIGGDERYCLMRTGTYNIFTEYCTCNSKDGCNAAGFLSTNNSLIITGIIIALLIARFYRY